MATKQITMQAWKSTPYANAEAKNPDASLMGLMSKYGITTHQITHHAGENGRPAVSLRFIFKGNAYRVTAESLDVRDVPPEKLINQAKRWIFWHLKSLFELIGYFAAAEQLMLGFLETGDGPTVYKAVLPMIGNMPPAASLLGHVQRQIPALPAPREVVQGELTD